MAKTIALIALFFLCAGIGIRSASGLERRVNMLQALTGSVKRLMTRLEYARLPLPQLLREEEFGAANALWRAFGTGLENGLAQREAWTAAMEQATLESRDAASLQEAERAALLRFASRLGSSDLRTEKEHAELLLSELASLTQEAAELYGKKGRIYRAMGVLCGAAVCILLV